MESFSFTMERELQFEVGGRRSVGKLRIGGIEKTDAGDPDAFWSCCWSLDEIHPTKGKIYGIDPLDAFLNCIQFLKLLIERHKESGYRVWWNAEGDDGGLCSPNESKG